MAFCFVSNFSVKTTKIIGSMSDSNNEQPKSKGGGFPKVPNRGSYRAVHKLRQLEFDPIEKLVDQYKELEVEIACMQNASSYSQVALAQLYAIKQKITADLLRYGYSRVPEQPDQSQKDLPPININLTTPEFKGEIPDASIGVAETDPNAIYDRQVKDADDKEELRGDVTRH